MTQTDVPERLSLYIPDLTGGGAQRAVLNLAAGLAEAGGPVDVVVGEGGGEMASPPPGVTVVPLAERRIGYGDRTLRLARYLRRARPSHMISALDIASVATVAKKVSGSQTKVVMTIQTHLSQQFRDRDGFHGFVRRQLVAALYPLADGLVAASRGTAEDARRMLLKDRPIHVIHNPAVGPEVWERQNDDPGHPWLAPDTLPVILGAGRIVHQKDFLTLAKAFDTVRQRMGARLIILGQPDPREPDIHRELMDFIRQRELEDVVAFPGFVANPWAWMKRASVFTLSSVYEGFGNVVAEALATGTPVVSTDCEAGPAEILDNGRYGRLVPVGDATAMAEAIVATLEGPVNRAALVERSRDFTIPRVAAQYRAYMGEIPD